MIWGIPKCLVGILNPKDPIVIKVIGFMALFVIIELGQLYIFGLIQKNPHKSHAPNGAPLPQVDSCISNFYTYVEKHLLILIWGIPKGLVSILNPK